MLHWHAVITKPNRELPVSVEIAARLGVEVYLPTMQRRLPLRAGGGLVTVARFTGWVFACFDAHEHIWEDLARDRCGIVRVVCDGDGAPIPMPKTAITAMREYKPQPEAPTASPRPFVAGERVDYYYMPGVPMQAVFVGYLKQKAMVDIWILGRVQTQVVSIGSLERRE